MDAAGTAAGQDTYFGAEVAVEVPQEGHNSHTFAVLLAAADMEEVDVEHNLNKPVTSRLGKCCAAVSQPQPLASSSRSCACSVDGLGIRRQQSRDLRR
jgi:hypothetical protein